MKDSGITLEKYIFFAHIFRIFKIYGFFYYQQWYYYTQMSFEAFVFASIIPFTFSEIMKAL